MAIGPIDYYSQYAPNIGGSLLQGLQIGGQLQANRANNLANTQALDYKQQQQRLMSDVLNNPNATAEEVLRVAALTNSNELVKVAESMQKGVDRSFMGALGKTYSSLLNNNPDAAKAALQVEIEGARNAKNDEFVAEYTDIYNAIDKGENLPEVNDKIKSIMLLFPSGREIVKNILPKELMELGKRKDIAATKEAEAKAETAFGAKELQRLQIMNTMAENDIKKLETAALEAKTPLEQQKLMAEAGQKRLKIDTENTKALQARDSELKTFGDVNTLIDDIITKSGVKLDEKGNVVDAGVIPDITGDIEGRFDNFVGMNSESKNEVLSLLAELQSSARLQGIQSLKGTGSVTEAEGAAAANSIGNLSRRGSPEFLIKQLLKIKQKTDSQIGRTKKHYQFLDKAGKAKESSLDDEATSLGLP